MAEVRAFLNHLYRLQDGHEAVDLAIDHFDDALIAGDWTLCIDTLILLDPEQVSSSVLVSVLGITSAADYLGSPLGVVRLQFYKKVFRTVSRRKGCRYAYGLLHKYKGRRDA